MKLKAEFIDSDKAERLLGITLGDKIISPDKLVKSFFQFSFDTPEGIASFLTVLPMLDKEAVQQAQEQLLPQSVDEKWDVARARFELRGLLMDVLSEGMVGPAQEDITAPPEDMEETEEEVDLGGT